MQLVIKVIDTIAVALTALCVVALAAPFVLFGFCGYIAIGAFQVGGDVSGKVLDWAVARMEAWK